MNWIDFTAIVTVLCILVQFYHYIGYPLVLFLLCAIRSPRGQASADNSNGFVTMIICAHNEGRVIREKLENTLALDPPPDEIIVVNDGSEDETLEVARAFEAHHDNLRVIDRQPRGGKAKAMNAGAEVGVGDILLFSDSSEMYEIAALKELLHEFTDPTVAVVSGSHRLIAPRTDVSGGMTGRSEGLYWRYEDSIRRMESRLGATVASVGSMLAIRRKDWVSLPPGIVNDDAWIAMAALARGRNVRFAHRAVGWEAASDSTKAERTRRLRITAGRLYLLSRREIWPLSRPGVLLAFLSHKVLRLFLPIPMILGAVANIAVVAGNPDRVFFVILLILQGLVAALALLGLASERCGYKLRLAHLAYHVVSSNLTILLALYHVVIGRNFTLWSKPRR